MADKDKKKGDGEKDKKGRRKYLAPLLASLGTLSVSKVAFATSMG